MYVCVCVGVCPISNVSLICDFMGFWIFWKKDVVALTYEKLKLSS